MVDISEKLGRAACTELQNEYSKDKVVFHLCDVTKLEQLVGYVIPDFWNYDNVSLCSIPQKSAFAQTKQEFGSIDIVCNNAGIANEDKWQLMLDINLVC